MGSIVFKAFLSQTELSDGNGILRQKVRNCNCDILPTFRRWKQECCLIMFYIKLIKRDTSEHVCFASYQYYEAF